MERFFKLLYYYFLGVFIFFVIYMVTVMFLSPRRDALKRGFIPCTEQLINDMNKCESGKVLCPLKYLWKDTKCNTSVVLDGFGAWIKGEQSNPWENYLFTPVSETKLEEYEDISFDDWADLEQQRQFIEEKQKELEDAKNRALNLKAEVLQSDPEKELENNQPLPILPEEYSDMEKGNIDDEAFIDNIDNQKETEEKKEKEKNEK